MSFTLLTARSLPSPISSYLSYTRSLIASSSQKGIIAVSIS